MARVLTVDDSRAVRSIIARQLAEWGLEVDEAEDGGKGLEKLEEVSYDLVLLDVTMPEMDGPTMLAKLRESGNRTPVVMLTSESKRSIVADAMKLGIEDYILKPFKPEELRTKIGKVLKGVGEAPGGAATAAAVATPSLDVPSAGPAGEPGSRKFVDVLLVDDMDNVHKRLRSLLPDSVSMDACTNAQAALQHVRERVYRVVIIDNVIPDVNSAALMNQIRALQVRATILSLCLRTADGALAEAKKEGFDGVLFKPLTPEIAEEFVAAYFDTSEILVVDGASMRVSEYTGREEGLETYYAKLAQRIKTDLERMAEACFEEVAIDAGRMPLKPERTVKLLLGVKEEAGRLGIGLRVRGSGELGKLLAGFAETAEIPFEAAA